MIEAVTADACAPGSTDTRGVGFAAAAPENFPRAKPAPYFNGTLRRRPHSLHQNVIASAGGHPLAPSIATSRRGETTPRGTGIPGAHAPTSQFSLPALLGSPRSMHINPLPLDQV